LIGWRTYAHKNSAFSCSDRVDSYLESQAALAMNQGSDTVAAFDRRMKQTKNLLLQRLEQSDNSNAA
jgi:hypothetical protein